MGPLDLELFAYDKKKTSERVRRMLYSCKNDLLFFIYKIQNFYLRKLHVICDLLNFFLVYVNVPAIAIGCTVSFLISTVILSILYTKYRRRYESRNASEARNYRSTSTTRNGTNSANINQSVPPPGMPLRGTLCMYLIDNF